MQQKSLLLFLLLLLLASPKADARLFTRKQAYVPSTVQSKSSLEEAINLVAEFENKIKDFCIKVLKARNANSPDSWEEIKKRARNDLASYLDTVSKQMKSILPSHIEEPELFIESFLCICGLGSASMVAVCIEAGMDPNIAQDETLMTPLMIATSSGNSGAVKTLLAHGATPDAQNLAGLSAIDYCAYIPRGIVVGDQKAVFLNLLSSIKYGTIEDDVSAGLGQCADLLIDAQKYKE